MNKFALTCLVTLAGCAYHQPPGLSPEDSIEFRNALGERRYCETPEASAGTAALNVLGGGLLGMAGDRIGRPIRSRQCADRLHAQGYAPVGEEPMPLDQLQALRAREAAEAEADMARRNAER